MEEIYIHKLNDQELGYRTGVPGKAGRYFYIAKQASAFFPALSESITNDYALINIVGDFGNEGTIAKYVYYNDKYSLDKNNGRDEFRLYLNNAYDRDRSYFVSGDIIVIRKFEINTTLVVGDGLLEKQIIYRVYRFPVENQNYRLLLNVLGERTHLLCGRDSLGSLELNDLSDISFAKKIVTDDIKDYIFSNQTVMEQQSIRRVRNVAFRDLVLMFYDYKCCITGRHLLIEYNNISNLEAAHIIPFSQNGADIPANGVAMNGGLHWAFDNGFFTFTENYTVKVHEKAMRNEFLKVLNGRPISLPEDSRAKPNLDSIRWHESNIFGRFGHSK